ncbi:DNA mismatch repair protein MSH2 [Puccinia graminis f. sp. tritici CRL 75-36-700-3]|uniref:DNA mismatch repair protein MSH2 n=2 Tax=Puccinia graminis f. sp. tritici TaxID=56615 RepID=E3JW27_PUCGT|nr:DNA mismatch repair protein MSH2 [Puccinia graminis f. sp. tritici CRL 75-36-700-3]EFP76252.2 DNA mismatch repair protein MSH2 [Puccinia graminis f. sp. tritici CRL 75-36-700-3]
MTTPMYPTKAPEVNEDQTASKKFCETFKNLEPCPKGTLRIFEREKGEFYTCYGPDAQYVATQFYRTNTVLRFIGPKTNGEPGLPSCSLSRTGAITFLRECLTSRQMRIQIYRSDQPSSKSSSSWSLAVQASPGNLEPLADLLFSNTDILSSPVIASLWVKGNSGSASGRIMGVAFADTSVRTLGLSEFPEQEDGWGNTESLIIQLGIKEAIIATPTSTKNTSDSSQNTEYQQLIEVLERCGVVVTERKRAEFTLKNVEQDINRLLSGDRQLAALPQFEMKTALAALNPLLNYLAILDDPSNHSAYKFITHDLGQFMRLDASAVRALHLFPNPTSIGGGGKNMSLFGLLNRCKTGQGTRLLGRWLKQPLVNLHEIEQRQTLVGIMFQDGLLRQTLQDDHLKAMPDLTRISKRFIQGAGSLEDVVRVYQAVVKLPEILEALDKADGFETGNSEEAKELLNVIYRLPFQECVTNLAQYVEMVETTVDLDELENHQFIIKPDFDDDLRELKNALDQNREQLDEEHLRVAQDLGMGTDSKVLHFENHQVYGYVFRLTRKEAGVIRSKKTYIELSNRNNGCHFTTKTLKELNNELKDLTQKYQRKQSSLVKEVVSIAASYCPILEKLNEIIAHLDLIVSFAHVSLNAPMTYTCPKMYALGEGDVCLKGCRHPCLEVQDDINFIPNDTLMERERSSFHIITGPNMGGKSTYIRQIGVAALMAQLGCYVPCAEASLPVFDSILARVGAGDSQTKGISTFMAEMLETAVILKSATPNSLIIIDELGRGTSTYDGFGLAWAISEHIAVEIKAFTLFATHFHELTTLDKQVEHVKNYHVVAHVEKKSAAGVSSSDITLLYKVEPGFSDQSFGIHVAEMANFPEDVLKLARRKAEELEYFGEEEVEDSEKKKKKTKAPTQEEVEEGTGLVRQMLEKWIDQDQRMKTSPDQMDLDDDQLKLDSKLKCLKESFQSFLPQLEQNPWIRDILMNSY